MVSERPPMLRLASSLRFQGALTAVANWTGYEIGYVRFIEPMAGLEGALCVDDAHPHRIPMGWGSAALFLVEGAAPMWMR